MAIERRSFLKTCFTGGALLASATPAYLTAAQDGKPCESSSIRPTILIRTNTSLDDVFIRGIAAADRANGNDPVATMVLSPLAQFDPVFLRRIFTDLKERRLIGMMEDGPFAILQALARTHGARFLCIGQHGWGNNEHYASHHRWLTAPRCRGVSAIMAAALAAGTEGYFVSEASLGADRVVARIDHSRLISTDHWAAVTGAALATIGAGKWRPAPAGEFQLKRRKIKSAVRGSLVSFVVET